MKIAIFGASSIIAREYVTIAVENSRYEFFLFYRSENIEKQSRQDTYSDYVRSLSYDSFSLSCTFDVIINFIGCGDPSRLKQKQDEILRVNDTFDNLILSYLKSHPKTKYIYLSSGASYLSDFEKPVDRLFDQTAAIKLGKVLDQYSLAKFISELKHRNLKDHFIVDLRIFNYLRGHLPELEASLIGQIFSSIKFGVEFRMNNLDVRRDYINAEIFYKAVECVLECDGINAAFDLYSCEPISKFEILELMSERYSLRYKIDNILTLKDFNTTGVKPNYFSTNDEIRKLGFAPTFSSREVLEMEAEKLFNVISN